MSSLSRLLLAVGLLASLVVSPGACTFPEYQFAHEASGGAAVGGLHTGGGAGDIPLGGSGSGMSGGDGGMSGSGGVGPEPTCTDGIRNGDETGTDCGGPECGRCANGQGCKSNDDCFSQRCHTLDHDCQTGLAVQCRCAMGSTNDCLNGSPLRTQVEVRIVNFSDEPIDLEGVVLRYYFAPENNDQAECAMSGLPGGCDGMRRVEQRPHEPPAGTHALELEFSAENGVVAPGEMTATTLIEVVGQPTLPGNDYSFEQNPTMRACECITLHRITESGGVLVWGEPPPTD